VTGLLATSEAGRPSTARPLARLPVSGIKLQPLHPFVHVLYSRSCSDAAPPDGPGQESGMAASSGPLSCSGLDIAPNWPVAAHRCCPAVSLPSSADPQ
jgi:hypothetical protein